MTTSTIDKSELERVLAEACAAAHACESLDFTVGQDRRKRIKDVRLFKSGDYDLPVSVQGSTKLQSVAFTRQVLEMNQELDLPFVGDMTHLDEESIEREIEAVLNDAEANMVPLRMRRKHLETRAMNNLSLLRY